VSPVRPFFTAENLHKRFGDRVVLENISLSFPEGTVSGIMGPNGAGKSTCFNVLTGLYRPDRGRISFDGEDITGLAPATIARKGISRSFQMMNLFDEFTAVENVMVALPRVRSGLSRIFWDVRGDSALMDEAREVLAKVGLRGRETTRAGDLPYGQRRALEIGVALAPKPRIVFLDEPTQGLGADGRAHLADLIDELRHSYTLVIIEHDMSFLFRLAERISVIHWGQVIAEGTPEELMRNEWVRASDLGKVA
jgi:branched-chain amino acid transport system ATP-binding protein